ncbi:MAG: 2-oxoglutarate dehydrogenase [Phycisphaerales bacterium]|nr:2-oxoglutarate dehydrogenase [Phycisphaerales bacterium]
MLRAITIIQPFAALVALPAADPRHKRCENRRWPTSYRGPLAVHAGKARRYGGEPCEDIAVDHGVDPNALAFGAIVTVVRMVACVAVEPGPDRRRSIDALGPGYAWMHDHAHAEGPWCHVYEPVWTPPQPVDCAGKQGLWTVPADVERAVRAAWYAGVTRRRMPGAAPSTEATQ